MAKSKTRPKKRKQHKPVRRAKPAKARKRRTKPVARKRKKRPATRKRKAATGARKKTQAKRKRSQGRKLVKQVEKRSVERVMAGKKPRKRRRRVRMAGAAPRRRTVGKSGNSGLLLGLAIGAGALWLLTKGSGSTTATNYGSLPPLSQTGNYTRDTQSQQIVNYALAAGLTINAITSLIKSLNTSTDSTVNNVYDKVNTTGSLTNLGLPGYDPIV